ncbi:MAG: transcriptional regulator [Promethearchaeota archaeon]
MVEESNWKTHRQKLYEFLENLEGEMKLESLMEQLEYSDKKALIKDLNRIAKNLKRSGKKLLINPPKCKKCGYIFKLKSGSLKVPSKCPQCHEERIEWPTIKVES